VSSPALGPTQPPIQLVSGALSLEVKRPGREAEHSPPSNAEVNNAWNYTSISLIRLHIMVLSLSTRTGLPLPLCRVCVCVCVCVCRERERNM
jgi:hypothetical protein